MSDQKSPEWLPHIYDLVQRVAKIEGKLEERDESWFRRRWWLGWVVSVVMLFITLKSC